MIRPGKIAAGYRWALLLLGGLLAAIQWQVLTYVTGEDPFTYARLAVQLLDARFSLAALREVASFIIPGFPILLAGVMALFGIYAVAWVNTVLMFLSGLLVLRILKRWGYRDSTLVLMIGLWMVLLFRQVNLHPYFLFYAFRGPAQFFFILLAYDLITATRPDRSQAPVRLIAATLSILLGTFVRETTLLAWPALLVAMLLEPAWKGHRRRGLFWLALPLLLSLPMALGWLLRSGVDWNSQAAMWLRFVTEGGHEAFVYRLRAYGVILFAEEWRWLGTLGFGLGVWHERRRPERLLLWLIPALLWVVFYSGFRVHRRFLLDSIYLLSVLAALGWAQTITLALARVPTRWRVHSTWAVVFVLIGMVAAMIREIPMWGPRVTVPQLQAFTAAIQAHDGGHTRVLVDAQCRHATEALMLYAEREPVYRFRDIQQVVGRPPALFLHTDTRTHWRSHPGIDLAEQLRRGADTVPVTAADGTIKGVHLGDIHYRLYTIHAWSQQGIEEGVSAEDVINQLLWLDFRVSDPEAQRQVELQAVSGETLQSWTITAGTGLIPLVVHDQAAWPEPPWRLVARSSSVLPQAVLARPRLLVGIGAFPLYGERRLSTLDWVGESGVQGRPEDRWGSTFANRVTFQLSRPRGLLSNQQYSPLWVFEPRQRQDQEVIFHYQVDGRPLATYTHSLLEHRIWHSFPAPTGDPDEPVEVELTVEGIDPEVNHFRIVYIGHAVADQQATDETP